MRKSLLFIPPVLVLLLSFIWWKSVSVPVNTRDTKAHDFLITRGQTLTQISKNLRLEGLIKSEMAFRLYAQFTGRGKSIQAGEYSLSPNLNLQQVIFTLDQGPTQIWITFPEGLRREEMAFRVIETLELDSQQSQIFWTEFLNESEGLEGQLFPDTYLFPKDVTATKVVSTLKNTFSKKITPDMLKSAQDHKLTQNNLITLASIVERETKKGDERPIVAGILLNRIDLGMPLQADATLQYITGTQKCGDKLNLKCDWWSVPTVDEKQLKSSYNTYLNPGLPPAPIANPGLEALKSAANPQDSDYVYYIHGNDGKIRYAKTLDEHNENISKYLQ